MSTIKPETAMDLDTLFDAILASFTSSAVALRETFQKPEWKDSPFIYHMPKMHVQVRLTLSHTDGTVRGVLGRKNAEDQKELASTVELDVVSVPRRPSGPPEGKG